MEKILSEDYCSPEVSKILKEKGLGKEHFRHYVQVRNGDGTIDAVSVCTHQIAMKWLREKEIDICIGALRDKQLGKRYEANVHKDMVYQGGSHFFRDTYEAAVEAALKYSLKNLI